MGAVDVLDCGEGEGNRRHDEDEDDAQTNAGVVPNSGGDDGDRALFHRRRRRNDDGSRGSTRKNVIFSNILWTNSEYPNLLKNMFIWSL